MVQTNKVYLPKDFIETSEGLAFAVVQCGVEHSHGQDKVLCFLRYVQISDQGHQRWQKMNTETANAYLKMNHPCYLYFSPVLDAQLHAVETNKIIKHYQPRQRLQQLINQAGLDQVEQDFFDLCKLLKQNGLDLNQVGVTGSLLIGAQSASSDIDLVFYDRELFQLARSLIAKLIEAKQLGALSENDWRDAYSRRSCALTFDDYVWHEHRKFNKGTIKGRKFDISFLAPNADINQDIYRKLGTIKLQCCVNDASYSFDYPALYFIDHPDISDIVCFTATYIGQAFAGERIEVAGFLEESDQGRKRIVIGASREAPGEYIKVIKPC